MIILKIQCPKKIKKKKESRRVFSTKGGNFDHRMCGTADEII